MIYQVNLLSNIIKVGLHKTVDPSFTVSLLLSKQKDKWIRSTISEIFRTVDGND